MNKHLYRIVFNCALRVWQVASELVRSPGGLSKAGEGVVTATVAPLRFALWCALGFVGFVGAASAQQAQGRIIADPNAPGQQRPTILEGPNGTPVVNITTPSAAGVSRNTYSEFSVGASGAVLNNSRTNTNTQLAGGIAGNPWLATGTAKVILNEVNGPASHLNGYLEVGGQRAEVVIANPAGIQVNGGGFLNASRVTLTTGRPVFNGGALDHYRVEGGAIQVSGAGLDASRADYTDLIARSLQVNAGIWAQQLQASLGTNTVRADHAQATAMTPAGTAPAFALDVGALGGMYANKIALIGNEHGVGVRNAGMLGAQAGELTVTVDGRLENTGALQSQQNTRIAASGGVANAGTISAARELSVTTPQDIDNRGGTLNAQRIEVNAASLRNRGGAIEQTGVQALALNAGALSNRDGGRIGLAEAGGGGNDPGTGSTGGGSTGGGSTGGGSTGGGSTGGGTPTLPEPLAEGALRIAGTLDNDGGAINAGGGVSLTTQNGLDNSGGRLGLRELTLTQGDLANADGELNVAGDANLTVGRIVNDAGRLEIGGALQVDARSLSNRGGTLSQAGTAVSTVKIADTLDNTGGVLASNASRLTLDSGVLVNEDGRIEHAGADGLTLRAGTLTGANGKIATAGAANLAVGQADHRNATLSASQITLQADGFDNRGGKLLAAGSGANRLAVRNTLDNGGGTMASLGAMTLQAGEFLNTGGTLQSASDAALEVSVDRHLANDDGTIESNGAVALSAASLSNQGGRVRTDQAMSANVVQRLDNTGGTIRAGGDLNLTAGELLNRDTWDPDAADSASLRGLFGARVELDAQTLDNTRGLISAEGDAEVRAGLFDNRAGTVFAQEDLTVDSAGDVINREGGLLQSKAGLTLTAGGTFDNTEGAVDAGGAGQLTAASLVNAGGQILAGAADQADAALAIAATGALDNRDGTIGSRGSDLTVRAAAIDNRAEGTLVAQRDLTLDAAAVNNAGGTVYATRALRYENAAATLDNAGGRFGAGETAWLTLASVANTNGGRIQAGTVWLTAPTLDIAGGEVAANTLHANLATLTGLGRLYGASLLDANFSGDFTYQNGQRFESDGLLDLSFAGTFTHQGTLQTAGELAISATNLINQGTLKATNDAGTGLTRVEVSDTLDNQRGASLEGDTVAIAAREVTNTGDIVGDAVGIEADLLTNGRDLGTAEATRDYGEGFIGAAETLELRVGQSLRNLDAELFSAGDLNIAGRTDGTRVAVLENVSGRIQAEGDASIAADRLDNVRRFVETEEYALSASEQAALYAESPWVRVEHVNDETLAALNAEFRRIILERWGHVDGYLVDDSNTPDDNPGADVMQADTYLVGTWIKRASAASELVTGGDLAIDSSERVLNRGSRIAAGGDLEIAGKSYDGSPDAGIENSAIVGRYTGERATTVWIRDPSAPVRYLDDGKWQSDVATFATTLTEAMTFDGPVLAEASITAGGAVTIEAGDVTNTAVAAGQGLTAFGPGALQGSGVAGPGTAAPQVIGTPERPLPGLVPADNGMFDIVTDPNAEFLVTTAPRFAKGDGTGSNYLLSRLGVTSDVHKRLGDGYYEQRLVMEQLLNLTGRRSLTGTGDGFAQYRALMDSAAAEAARLGLALGAPLTSSQIAALGQDIVWLVEQEVNGQKVLVPVVYLSQATAERMKAEGALIAGDTVDIQSSTTVRNDGTLQSQGGTWLSADTLINDGAIRSGGRLDIATLGDTLNRGQLAGHAVTIDAGGDLVNTVRFDGVNALGGVIQAGAGGVQAEM